MKNIKHKKSQSQVLVDIVKSFDRKDLVIAEIGIWKSHTVKRVLKTYFSVLGNRFF